MTTSNPDQPVQPTDEVQKYLLTQMVTINENLLKMEAAFEAAELARKFSEDLAEQSSAVDDLALAVSEFKMMLCMPLKASLKSYQDMQLPNKDTKRT